MCVERSLDEKEATVVYGDDGDCFSPLKDSFRSGNFRQRVTVEAKNRDGSTVRESPSYDSGGANNKSACCNVCSILYSNSAPLDFVSGFFHCGPAECIVVILSLVDNKEQSSPKNTWSEKVAY